MIHAARIVLSFIFCIFVGSLIVSDAVSGTLGPRLKERLSVAADAEMLSVIVSFSGAVSLDRLPERGHRQARTELVQRLKIQAESSQSELWALLEEKGISYTSLWISNRLSLKGPPELIEELLQWPGVDMVVLEGRIQVPEVTVSAAAVDEWNLEAIDAPALWALGFRGNGMLLASFDTGVDETHPDLSASWRGGSNSWFDPYNVQPSNPYDPDGHGTAVTSLMTGGAAAGSGIGVAPDAQWITAKIFNDSGFATFTAIHESFEWALDPDGDAGTDDAPHVVNNSWGLDNVGDCTNEFLADVQNLRAAGIAVVFAAGNDGNVPGDNSSPANYTETIAVGMVDQQAAIDHSSSRGPSACTGELFPNLAAPGVDVKAALPSSSYALVTGTSFSSPHVAAGIALLMEAEPTATLVQVETALQQSADDLGAEGPDNVYGHGQMDLLAAYRYLKGEPHLSLYDPTPPENDFEVDFGTILPGSGTQRTLTLRNAGMGSLTITSLTVDAPYSISSENCIGNAFAGGESCQISVNFAPSSNGSFSRGLQIVSSHPDGDVSVALTGVGDSNLTPPQISISQEEIDFEMVPPGRFEERLLTITNEGQENLVIASIVSPLSPFSISADSCSGRSLPPTIACSLTVRFSPESTGEFSEAFAIVSNDPNQGSATISLNGIGNTLPPAPVLSAPDDGAQALADPVVFEWIQPFDRDGETVVNTLLVSTFPDFGQVVPFVVQMDWGAGAGVLAATSCGLFLAAALVRCRRRWFWGIVVLMALWALAACGGGSSSGISGEARSQSVSGLDAQTTYYWKVVATDAQGGTSESGVRQFTTQ